MAKSLKAPGRNGEATLATLVDELESRAKAYTHDPYWRDRILASATGAIAFLLGESTARGIAEYVEREPVNESVALALIARGLARKGDADAARTAVAQARAVITRAAIDGEHGTIAWNAVALALHSLNDPEETDRALDAAQLAAEHDTVNPSQPWPHFAVALARTGRLTRLAEMLRGIPSQNISFDIARAAKMGVAQSVATGNVRAYQGFHDALLSDHAFELLEGIRGGARAAIEGGHTDALRSVMERFCAARSYADDLASKVGVLAASLGRLALGLELVTMVRDRLQTPSCTIAWALETLGDDAGSAAEFARLPSDRRAPRALNADLGRAIGVLLSRGSERAEPVIDEAVARGRSDAIDGSVGIGYIAQGLLHAGRTAQAQTLLAEAVSAADAVPKKTHGWQRNNALRELAQIAAAEGEWAAALKVYRACGSKSDKARIASALAQMYARAGDFAGARMALEGVAASENKGLMNSADVLLVLAGDEPQWSDWS